MKKLEMPALKFNFNREKIYILTYHELNRPEHTKYYKTKEGLNDRILHILTVALDNTEEVAKAYKKWNDTFDINFIDANTGKQHFFKAQAVTASD